MAKRFSDTNKWDDEWYMSLPSAYKLAYQYILDKCDSVGVWKPNYKLAEFVLSEKIDWEDFKSLLGKCRLYEMKNGNWWLIKFCDFQYGALKDTCRPHVSFIEQLKKHSLYIPYTKGLNTPKEKEKDKDKEKDKEKETEENLKIQFDSFRQKYPGRKGGLDVEFEYFIKKNKEYRTIIPLLGPAIDRQLEIRRVKELLKEQGDIDFIANWKDLQTWLNGKCWTEEEQIPVFKKKLTELELAYRAAKQ